MSVGGYVLAGGNSTRMGRDKALLEMGAHTLVQQIAGVVREATGNVSIVGDPAKYGTLGFPVIPDLRPGKGPLAGMEAALLNSAFEWNLMVACDLAGLRANFLRALCDRAQKLPEKADCLIPNGPDGRLQPLSGLYRRRCLSAFSAGLDRDRRRLMDVVDRFEIELWQTDEPQMFQNVNTPEEWTQYVNGRINNEQPPR